ncbi:MAG TPA: CoA-binding protein [Candidatus Sulfotelmatobacter sp.]|jgi:hypothetical protein|nr:CoA-binding protein [Candidatus Sulfotelmatobacter sp.]
MTRQSLEAIENFLAQKRIAIAGVSRNSESDSQKMFEALRTRGYDVVPVNPKAIQVQGQRCFSRVQDIQPPVHGVLVMTSARVADKVVSDCAEAGVRRIWLYRGAAGQGSVSERALAICENRGIEVVAGQCPFMFLPGASGVHRFHGLIRKMIGRYPKHCNGSSKLPA